MFIDGDIVIYDNGTFPKNGLLKGKVVGFRYQGDLTNPEILVDFNLKGMSPVYCHQSVLVKYEPIITKKIKAVTEKGKPFIQPMLVKQCRSCRWWKDGFTKKSNDFNIGECGASPLHPGTYTGCWPNRKPSDSCEVFQKSV